MAVKIAHEAPKSIFSKVQSRTDYDYALVHLLEDPEYLELFQNAIAKGREVILDNSIFELGSAFDMNEFYTWIKRLNPTWYIVPDVLESAEGTIVNMSKWNSTYNIPSKKIGVVQGDSYEEIVRCYRYLDQVANVNMIAISFDYSYYEKLVPHPNKYISWMLGRITLLGRLLQDGVVNTNRKHHLLGVALPQEGLYYRSANYDWIYSMDTSNPVVHGMKGIRYFDFGLLDKESQKLHELINSPEPIDNLVYENISHFRWFWNSNNNKLYDLI